MDLTTEHLIQRGRQAFERREYAAALADFRQVLERRPGFADIRHLAGLCLSFLGQPEAALEEFDRALALNDRYIEAHLNRAITLNELGRFDEAWKAFERAGRFELEHEGRYPAAVSARLANAHAAVGDLYLSIGSAAEAAEQYRAALRLRPGFLDIRNKLAQALLQLGDLDGAEHELTVAVRAHPRFLAARLNLGLVHFRRGDHEAAAAAWEACREQDPDHSQVRAYLAMLERRPVAHDPSDGSD